MPSSRGIERRGGKLKALIPSQLDDAGLSAAEFRVYCTLARHANTQGIAWPSYERMIEITKLSKRTIRRCLKVLVADHKLIRKVGKPFGGSSRYQLAPIVSPEGQKAASNSATKAPIEAAPIVPPRTRNSATRAPSIVPPEHQEGYPLKGIHLRVSNKEKIELPFSSDEFREAWSDWQQHRREIKKPLTSTSVRYQLKDLAALGEAEAIAKLTRSITSGWQGMYDATRKTKPDHREAKARREYPEPKAPLPML
jgi:hypothetical protein